MPVSRQQAVVNALRVTTYPVGMCARFAREQYAIPALGDADGDGDADAVDMWKACRIRNAADLNPPAGVPVFWGGGSEGHGHAAVSLGNGSVRSIDRPSSGRVASVPISEISRVWGLPYLGWTEDLYGHEIPDETAAVRAELARRKAKKRARIKTLWKQIKKIGDRQKRLGQ